MIEGFCVCAGMALTFLFGLMSLLVGGNQKPDPVQEAYEEGLYDAGEILAPLDPFHLDGK